MGYDEETCLDGCGGLQLGCPKLSLQAGPARVHLPQPVFSLCHGPLHSIMRDRSQFSVALVRRCCRRLSPAEGITRKFEM